MSTWTINGSSNYQNLRRTLTAGGQDYFDFESASATSASDAEVITYGTTVTVLKDATQWFKGTVISNPRLASGNAESQSVRVAGPMHLLSRCTYQQSWLIYDEDGDENINVNKSRVILNKDASGNRITTGAQIEAVIDYAIAAGISITKGTIDAGTELPFDERTNMTCADVINTMLRYLPDYVMWFDYSTTNPTFHCRKKSNLAAVGKAITSGDLLNMTARKDLQVPGVVITYEKTSTVDSRTRLSIETDEAGTTDAIETVHATFELEGSSKTTVKAEIETAEIPDQASPNGATFKAYVRELFPALADVADADLIIESASRTGTKSNYIVKGPVPSWVDDTVESDEQVFKISAAVRRGGNPVADVVDFIRSETFKIRLQTTDKESGTYTQTTSYDSGESTPTGVAAALYAAWSVLHFEGGFDYTLDEVDGSATPGKVFNLTGASAEINSKASLIQSCTEDIDTGKTTIQFGPPRRLEADTLIGLFRAIRSRRYSRSKSSQSDPEISAGSAEITGAAAERFASSANREHSAIKLIKENETDELEHALDLDPSQLTFADPSHKAAKTLKPTEAFILVIDGTGLSAKRVQMLACEPYGDAVTILPSGLTQGDLLQFGATQLGRLAIGAANDYLKSNGTTSVWQTPTEGCS